MKIVLCVTPKFHFETPPLGLAYLKSSLAKNGHSAICLDLSEKHDNLVTFPLGLSDKNIKEYLEQDSELIDSWVDKIELHKPDIVGITLWISNKNTACALASVLKKRLPHVVILGGGPDCLYYNIKEYLNYFDYIIEKEGELAICQFIEEYQKGGKVFQTKGVWYKKGKEICLTAQTERIRNLDALPYPDFSDFDIKSYQDGISVMFSRGCNANCTFCTNKNYFHGQVSRTGINMYKEIITQVEKTGCDKFNFVDDSLLSLATLKDFMLFCDKVIKNRLKIEWRIYGQRITPLLDEDCVEKMKKAGLKVITFGVESFSSAVRKDMNKVISNVITDRTLSFFINKGVKVSLLMIYGYPIETDENFDETLSWIKQNAKNFLNICFNCFVVTSEYCDRRPDVVKFKNATWHPYRWHSNVVNLEKRKQRFLQLVELLDDINVEYMISEPCLKRYYRNWDKQLKVKLEEEWSNNKE